MYAIGLKKCMSNFLSFLDISSRSMFVLTCHEQEQGSEMASMATGKTSSRRKTVTKFFQFWVHLSQMNQKW